MRKAFFNFTWSIGFFYFQNPLIGFLNIILLDIFVINYTLKSYPVNKVSSLLFIPYLIWLLFATYLNGYILMYN
jgi:tryptophan-rich sensory protein